MPERVAAFVEGHLEGYFMESCYPDVRVQRFVPNGKSVALGVIVSALLKRLDLLDGEVRRVVVLFDRERRSESAEFILGAVSKALQDAGSHRRVYLGLPDRMSENWILADEQAIAERFKQPTYSYPGDGTNGKRHIIRLCGGRETPPRELAKWLKAISVGRARTRSPSLDSFAAQIDFEWSWVEPAEY